MLVDAYRRDNLASIKRFLSMQKVVNSRAKYEVHFLGGSPSEIIVHVNKIQGIDIAATLGLIDFNSIHIYRKDRRWTNKSADKCYEAIAPDLALDGCTEFHSSRWLNNNDNKMIVSFVNVNV
jgi:hypothetical protein